MSDSTILSVKKKNSKMLQAPLSTCATCTFRFTHANSESHPGSCFPLICSIVFSDSRMRSWIWAFVVRLCPKTRFRMARLICTSSSYDSRQLDVRQIQTLTSDGRVAEKKKKRKIKRHLIWIIKHLHMPVCQNI